MANIITKYTYKTRNGNNLNIFGKEYFTDKNLCIIALADYFLYRNLHENALQDIYIKISPCFEAEYEKSKKILDIVRPTQTLRFLNFCNINNFYKIIEEEKSIYSRIMHTAVKNKGFFKAINIKTKEYTNNFENPVDLIQHLILTDVNILKKKDDIIFYNEKDKTKMNLVEFMEKYFSLANQSGYKRFENLVNYQIDKNLFIYYENTHKCKI